MRRRGHGAGALRSSSRARRLSRSAARHRAHVRVDARHAEVSPFPRAPRDGAPRARAPVHPLELSGVDDLERVLAPPHPALFPSTPARAAMTRDVSPGASQSNASSLASRSSRVGARRGERRRRITPIPDRAGLGHLRGRHEFARHRAHILLEAEHVRRFSLRDAAPRREVESASATAPSASPAPGCLAKRRAGSGSLFFRFHVMTRMRRTSRSSSRAASRSTAAAARKATTRRRRREKIKHRKLAETPREHLVRKVHQRRSRRGGRRVRTPPLRSDARSDADCSFRRRVRPRVLRRVVVGGGGVGRDARLRGDGASVRPSDEPGGPPRRIDASRRAF